MSVKVVDPKLHRPASPLVKSAFTSFGEERPLRAEGNIGDATQSGAEAQRHQTVDRGKNAQPRDPHA
jgi:hypothetical protein